MNKTTKRILSFLMAMILLSLSVLSFPVTAEDQVGEESTLQETNQIAETTKPLEAEDSTGLDFVEVFPVEPEGGLVTEEIPSGGLIEEENPSAEPYATITSTIVPDGVYALRNVGNGDLWMDIAQNAITPGAYVQQYNFSGTSPVENFSRSGLFKISYNSSTGTYVIRSMLNNLLSFGFVGNYVQTKTIPADDADVALADTFIIKRISTGYVIMPSGSLYTVSANNTTASGAAGAPNSYLVKRIESAAGTRAIWAFEQYTGTAKSGVSVSISPEVVDGLTVGNTSTVTLYTWTTAINANLPYVEVPSAYAGTAECVATSTVSQFKVTGTNAGISCLYYRIKYASGTNLATYYGTFLVTPPIAVGSQYYIQNVATEKYMDVEGPSTAEGAYIQQWTFSTATQKKWVFTKVSGGYYTIKSAYSNLYVGVDSSNTSLVKQYSTVNDYTKWYFVQLPFSRYALYNKALSSSAVLTAPSEANGGNLTLAEYIYDTNYSDLWSLYEIRYNAVLYSYYDKGFNVFYSETEAISREKINQYNLSVAERYVQLYGLNVQLSSVQYFNSPIDICKGTVTSSNIDTLCTHQDPHTDRSAVIDDFYFVGNDTTTYAYWSCHKIMSKNEANEDENNRSCATVTCVYMLERASLLEPNRQTTLEGVLMHELNHQYGAKDHYHVMNPETGRCINESICSTCGIEKRPESCIMNYAQIDIDVSTVICSSCKDDIISHLDDHH